MHLVMLSGNNFPRLAKWIIVNYVVSRRYWQITRDRIGTFIVHLICLVYW